MMHHLQLAGAPQDLKIAVMAGADGLRRGVGADELSRLITALLPGQPVVRVASGRPVVRGRDDLHLSLAHAAGVTALAVAPFPVGIDIEGVDPELDVLAIAPDLFGPRDFAFVQQQDAASRLEHFYRLWTLKEARLKRLGRTLADAELPEIIEQDGRLGADVATSLLTLGMERYCVGVCWGSVDAPLACLASANCL